MLQKLKKILSLRRRDELGKIENRLKEVILGIAESGKYDMIFTNADVTYASDNSAINITSKVLKNLIQINICEIHFKKNIKKNLTLILLVMKNMKLTKFQVLKMHQKIVLYSSQIKGSF